jgi:uncharacterized protein (TIGR03086 family)
MAESNGADIFEGADPLELLIQAVGETERVVAGVRPEQANLPTPCAAFDVRALVNHVVLDVEHFAATAAGEPWEAHDDDVIGDDWPLAYRQAANELIEAWRREGVTGRMLRSPAGEVPASWSVGLQLTDLVVHGWDVARATGQSFDGDERLSAIGLAWARPSLQPEFRGAEGSGKSFGPEVEVPADARALDRLVGFFGRDPAWRP